MAKVQRNELCPCGSGLKAKRCCLASDDARVSTAKATLARLQPTVVPALAGIGEAGFRAFYNEMVDLPELDVSLHLRLPGLVTPEIEYAMCALSDEDHDEFDQALRKAAKTLVTVERRLELAEAVLKLRDRGLIPPKLAAVAIIDLNRDDSALALSALAQAIAVAVGNEPTPSGLLVAAR